MKQWFCHHTIYHDTTNQDLTYFGHMIYVLQTSMYRKYCKTFNGISTHPGIFYAQKVGNHLYLHFFYETNLYNPYEVVGDPNKYNHPESECS